MNTILLLLLNTLADTTGTDDDLHENKAVGIIILIVVFGLALWLAWPSLKANNVFSKKSINNYGTSEEVLNTNDKAASALLTGIFAIAYLGLALMIYPVIFPSAYRQGNSMGEFGVSLAGTIAAFIYTFIDESRFARVYNIKYVLKVWLTTIVASPLVLIFMDIKRITNVGMFLTIYTNTVMLGHGLGIITFTVLLFSVNHYTRQFIKPSQKRLGILLCTEAALLITMLFVALAMHSGMKWLLEIAPYAVIMGAAIWFYPIDIPVFKYKDEDLE